MEVREYAERLLDANTLEGKLAPPGELTDDAPGAAVRWEAPVRPPSLPIVHAHNVKVPRIAGMADPNQRARILHALANHELQAAELFAWALLAFPDTPKAFRRGLLTILSEEQTHCRLYIERAQAFGVSFGDLPVTGHFWKRIAEVKTPLDFVCTMGLTFENANLDFAGEYKEAALRADDKQTADVLDVVHRDEIRHVAFAWRWLQRFRSPDATDWDAYLDGIAAPLHPGRARGKLFDERSRQEAGLSDDFIEKLASETARRPGGAPR